ncbi:MAG: phage portal protein [Betaproteobacteria bacterium]|nr:phage portal protein [Betaproteobacteria bacterium]
MPPIPSGAKTTDLAPVANAARKSGFLTRVTSAVRYAIAGVTPDVWMSPNQPMTPVAQQAAGRQFDYPVGTNLFYTPRGQELTSFQQLRALADNCDLVRLAIETRKDQMAALSWNIVNLDQEKKAAKGDTRIDAVIAMMARPDGIHGWQSWLRMLLEEVLVTDAPTVYPKRRNNGDPLGFELIDGTLIKPLVDDSGRQPAPPSPAYQQVLKGMPAVDYTADELIYAPRNPRVNKFYGYSPVEQIILTVNIALRRAASQLQYFTEGNIPAAFASVPTDWNPDQIKAFQTYWDAVIEGDQAYKRKVRFVPGGTKVENIKDAPLKDEFDEWLARVICYAFSLPPTQFTKQATRTTSDALQEASLKEGLAPLKVWVKEVMDNIVQRALGFVDLEFNWVEEEALDPQSQQVIFTGYQKTAIYSINDVRKKLGDDPISHPAGDEYLIYTATGAVTLDSVMNPPTPMIMHDPNDPNAPPKAAAPNPGKPAPKGSPVAGTKPATAEKHAHDHLHKSVEPLTADETTLRDAFATALDVVRDAAVKQASTLGKAAADGNDGRNYTPEDVTVFADEFAAALDTSGLSLVFDDYTDTVQAVTSAGAKHQVAQLIVTEPDIATTEADAVASIFGGKDPDAIAWAKEHVADMLGKDGKGGKIEQATRDMIREAITKAMQADDSLTGIADMLEVTYAFSPERAELIARTEVGNAQGNGAWIGAKAVGMKAKKWLESNDENECPLCHANADQGWIPVEKAFVSGAQAPLQHPRCQCDQAYRRKPVED